MQMQKQKDMLNILNLSWAFIFNHKVNPVQLGIGSNLELGYACSTPPQDMHLPQELALGLGWGSRGLYSRAYTWTLAHIRAHASTSTQVILHRH